MATSPTWTAPQAPRLPLYPSIDSFPSLAALDLVSALDPVLSYGTEQAGPVDSPNSDWYAWPGGSH